MRTSYRLNFMKLKPLAVYDLIMFLITSLLDFANIALMYFYYAEQRCWIYRSLLLELLLLVISCHK